MNCLSRLADKLCSLAGSETNRTLLYRQFGKIIEGKTTAWFTPPDTFSIRAAHKHNGAYRIKSICDDGTETVIEVVKESYYEGSHLTVKNINRYTKCITHIKRIDFDDIEHIWDLINHCEFEKDADLKY